MESINFLHYSIGTGFLVLVGFISYAFYNLSKSLKETTSILSKVDDITKDVESLKNIIKSAISYLMSMFNNKREVTKK
ncbi:MAG: DUF948 domain-containing protein [Patescibacteria group bacterium]